MSWDADVDTGKSSTFISHTVHLRVCKRHSCQGLVTTKSATTWQEAFEQMTNPAEASSAHGRRATLCTHSTAVQMREGDAVNPALQRAKTRHTARLFICWQAKLQRQVEIGGTTGRRCGNHLPFSQVVLPKFRGASSQANGSARLQRYNWGRERKHIRLR